MASAGQAARQRPAGSAISVEKTMTSAIKAKMQLFANTGNRGPLPAEGLQLSDINSGNVRRG